MPRQKATGLEGHMIERYYHIRGLVQGVGFRPFVEESCKRLYLGGWVANSGGNVWLKVYGKEKAVDELIRRLFSLNGNNRILPGACVNDITLISERDAADNVDISFVIRESEQRTDSIRILPADIGICDSCRKQLFDPADRRFRHPFISCVSCGPRYTIMKGVPYDRERTTMSGFPLCNKCIEDYSRSGDIRRYAQTVCCRDCGPVLSVYDLKSGVRISDNDSAIETTVKALKEERIAAIKDVGGYHLAHLASSETAARRLREYKSRKYKAFAVMFYDLAAIEEVAYVSEAEKRLLISPERPIVLLKRRNDALSIAESISPDSDRIGAMLPCNPALLLIIKETGALVMTSANMGGEPIIADNDEMERVSARSGVIDIILSNNRHIESALDDSVCQVISVTDGKENKDIVQIIRRARGYVPKPVIIKGAVLSEAKMAAGGDLKSVFALGQKEAVYLSGHFGDLYDKKARKARLEAIEHMEALLDIKPAGYAGDAHPGYVSTMELPEGFKRVMHHHAHILSVMAEHNLHDNVLGVAYDGTGYGDDGNVWGGEFLICDKDSFIRAGHIRYAKLMGGDISATDCDSTAYGWLEGTAAKEVFQKHITKRSYNKKEWENFGLRCKAIDKNINTIYSSSMGRLFDAAAAVLEICHYNEYEGRAPMMLEAAAERYSGKDEEKKLLLKECPVSRIFTDGNTLIADPSVIIEWIFNKKQEGVGVPGLAYAFHMAIAEMTVEMCDRIKSEYGLNKPPIALSGGVMNNSLLLQIMFELFSKKGYRVYVNEAVPGGDGGLALGQMYHLMKKELKNVCSATGDSRKH